MSERITVGQLLDQLSDSSGPVPREALLRINGEYVEALTIEVQNPLVERYNESSRFLEVGLDESRSLVVDILANGREAERLPARRVGLVG